MEESLLNIDCLPEAVLAGVFALLSAQDLARCELVNRVWLALSKSHDDSLWGRHVERWLASKGAYPTHFGTTLSAKVLHSVLRTDSIRTLFRQLHALQGWPVGVWRHTNTQPHGSVMTIVLHMEGYFRLYNAVTGQDAHMFIDPFRVKLRMLEDSVRAVLELKREDGICISCTFDSDRTMHLRTNAMRPFHYELVTGIKEFPAPGYPERCTIAGQLPWAKPPPLEDILGLYTARYGGHGFEHIAVRLEQLSADSNPPGCPYRTKGVLLTGWKVTGDANVPSGSYTFVADPCTLKVEAYDGQDPILWSEDVPHSRPIVYYEARNTRLIDFSSKPVLGHMKAKGVINKNSAVWAPEWVDGTLLLFGGGSNSAPVNLFTGKPLPGTFAVLWHDEGSSFRHIMTYEPLKCPAAAMYEL